MNTQQHGLEPSCDTSVYCLFHSVTHDGVSHATEMDVQSHREWLPDSQRGLGCPVVTVSLCWRLRTRMSYRNYCMRDCVKRGRNNKVIQWLIMVNHTMTHFEPSTVGPVTLCITECYCNNIGKLSASLFSCLLIINCSHKSII